MYDYTLFPAPRFTVINGCHKGIDLIDKGFPYRLEK